MASGKDELMTLKIAGAILVVLASAGFGFCMSAHRRREIRLIRDILRALVYMESELRYKLASLPELFEKTAVITQGTIGKLLNTIARSMEQQADTDISSLVNNALDHCIDLPESCYSLITQLGKTLGCFGLEGQASELQVLQEQCKQLLEKKTTERDKYVRCYETLGICCGAALVIILL